MGDRIGIAREMYRAFADGDRDTIERILAPGFTFSSPLDVGLDRAGYFERCWPGAGEGQRFEVVRVVSAADTVFVTYELVGANGSRGRNTEVLTFEGDRVREVEVYFGWTIDAADQAPSGRAHGRDRGAAPTDARRAGGP